MAKEFTAQVHSIIRRNKAVLTMVAQTAVQDVINEAQLSKAKGGKMPVKLGFLRRSGSWSFTGLPTGPVRPDKSTTYASPDSVTITGFKLGRSIYWGWTAAYARKQNLYNGFLDSAIGRWQEFVDNAVRKLRDRVR